jgi:hypothetical protein
MAGPATNLVQGFRTGRANQNRRYAVSSHSACLVLLLLVLLAALVLLLLVLLAATSAAATSAAATSAARVGSG